MSEDREADVSVEEQPRELSPAAKRALAEAEERRRKEAATEMPPEIGGEVPILLDLATGRSRVAPSTFEE